MIRDKIIIIITFIMAISLISAFEYDNPTMPRLEHIDSSSSSSSTTTHIYSNFSLPMLEKKVNNRTRAVTYFDASNKTRRIDIYHDVNLEDYSDASEVGSIQWAINQMCSEGGLVFLMNGNYTINSSIIIDCDWITIQGAVKPFWSDYVNSYPVHDVVGKPGGAKITAMSNITTIIGVGNTTTYMHGDDRHKAVVLRDVYLDGNNMAYYGVYDTWYTDISEITNCMIQGTNISAISISWDAPKITFNSIQDNNGDAIRLTATTPVIPFFPPGYIAGNVIYDNRYTDINVTVGSPIITGNMLGGKQTGIYLGKQTSGILVYGNTIVVNDTERAIVDESSEKNLNMIFGNQEGADEYLLFRLRDDLISSGFADFNTTSINARGIQTPNITAPNICYANGTNCISSSANFTNVSFINNTEIFTGAKNFTQDTFFVGREGSYAQMTTVNFTAVELPYLNSITADGGKYFGQPAIMLWEPDNIHDAEVFLYDNLDNDSYYGYMGFSTGLDFLDIHTVGSNAKVDLYATGDLNLYYKNISKNVFIKGGTAGTTNIVQLNTSKVTFFTNVSIKTEVTASRLCDESGCINVTQLRQSLHQYGDIVWSNETKSGNCWHIADGTEGTYNLTDRFIVAGNGSYPIMSIGGNVNTTLTINNSAPHNHSVPATVLTAVSTSKNTYGNAGVYNVVTAVTGTPHAVFDRTEGNAIPFSNTPPYFSLLAYEWVCR